MRYVRFGQIADRYAPAYSAYASVVRQYAAGKRRKPRLQLYHQQNGMFSFSGLTKEQVLRLREEFGVYAVASGRVNVAGMTPDNMAPLCEAIVAVL